MAEPIVFDVHQAEEALVGLMVLDALGRNLELRRRGVRVTDREICHRERSRADLALLRQREDTVRESLRILGAADQRVAYRELGQEDHGNVTAELALEKVEVGLGRRAIPRAHRQ